jgi:hypothetical protein
MREAFILPQGIYRVAADGRLRVVAGGGEGGFHGDGGPAISAKIYYPSGVAVDSADNLFIADRSNYRIRKVIKPKISADLVLSSGAMAQAGTTGIYQDAHPGYATVSVNSGAVPYGTAIFSLKQNGVTVSEAGIPASPPTTAARVFIDYRSGVNAIPSRGDAGVVGINTAIAVVNNGTTTANVTYTLRNASGNTITTGQGTIDAGKHYSCFIDQLKDVAAPDFNLSPSFQSSSQFGTLDITSDRPLSIVSLRGTVNQREQFLITTVPSADLTQFPGISPRYFAQFVDGDGYTTSLILMNTSAATETGTLQIMDNNGDALFVKDDWGRSGFSFRYSIPPNGFYRLQTDGLTAAGSSGGSLILIPQGHDAKFVDQLITGLPAAFLQAAGIISLTGRSRRSGY